MSSITFSTRDLPSVGLFYDKEYNITLNQLSLGQYKELMRCNERYFKHNILNVLSEIVETDGLDVESMYYGDVIALLMWYKCNSSIDTNLKFGIKCSSCGNRVEFNVNLGEFDIRTIEGYDRGVKLPSGKFLEFSPKTFMEYEKSTNPIEHICNIFKYLTPYEVDDMDIDDFIYLNDFVSNFNMGFKYIGKTTCRFCKKEYDVKLDADYNYIFKHVDYSTIISNILHISKFTNYKFTNDEDLFDYETSVNTVSEMIKKEEEEYENLTKKS